MCNELTRTNCTFNHLLIAYHKETWFESNGNAPEGGFLFHSVLWLVYFNAFGMYLVVIIVVRFKAKPPFVWSITGLFMLSQKAGVSERLLSWTSCRQFNWSESFPALDAQMRVSKFCWVVRVSQTVGRSTCRRSGRRLRGDGLCAWRRSFCSLALVLICSTLPATNGGRRSLRHRRSILNRKIVDGDGFYELIAPANFCELAEGWSKRQRGRT